MNAMSDDSHTDAEKDIDAKGNSRAEPHTDGNSSKPRRIWNSSRLAIIFVFTLPVLYVLSVGPAVYYFESTGQQPPDWVETFYWPLEWLHANTFLREPLDWYLRLFR